MSTTHDQTSDEAAERDSKYSHRRLAYWREKAVDVFHKVAELPGYEKVDEDTASALVCHYADEMAAQFSTGLAHRDRQVKEAVEYCMPYIDQMWASRVVGILIDCDFKDADEHGKKFLEDFRKAGVE